MSPWGAGLEGEGRRGGKGGKRKGGENGNIEGRKGRKGVPSVVTPKSLPCTTRSITDKPGQHFEGIHPGLILKTKPPPTINASGT